MVSIFVLGCVGVVCGQVTNTGKYFESIGDSLFNQSTLKEAVENYLKAESIYESSKEYESQIRILNYLSWISYSDKNIVDLEEYTKKANHLSNKYLKENNKERLFALNQLNTYFYSIGSYQKSIEVLKKELLERNLVDSINLDLVNTYYNLAISYKFVGDLNASKSYLLKASSFLEKFPSEHSFRYDVNVAMGHLFSDLQKPDSTIYYLERNGKFYDKLSKKNQYHHKLNLCEAYLNADIPNKALPLLKELTDTTFPSEYYEIYWLELYGKYYQQIGFEKLALEYLKKADALAISTKKRNTSNFKLQRLLTLVEIESSDQSTQQLKYIDSSLDFLGIDSLFSENKLAELNNKSKAIEALRLKSRLLLDQNKSEVKLERVEEVLKTSGMACDLLMEMRNEILTEGSKNILSETNKSFFELAIYSSSHLYNLGKEERYVNRAYELMENNKAQLLIENLTEAEAKGVDLIPKDILEKEKEISLQINYLRKRKSEGNKINESQLRDLVISKNNLIASLEEKYPRYYQIKYSKEKNDIHKIQNGLHDEKAILEYFYGVDSVYAILIEKNDTQFLNLGSADSLSKMLDGLIHELQSPVKENQRKSYQNFSLYAHELFERLINGFSISSSVQELTIVPDGKLNFLPFETLVLKQEENPSYHFRDQDYLFEHYNIDYQYSNGHRRFIQKFEKLEYEFDVLGVAPEFDGNTDITTRSCTRNNLSPLSCNIDEVSSIASGLKSQILVNADATIQRFNEFEQRSKIIHLATHACIDEESTENNRIFFQNNDLSHLDLQTLELNSEMVVLSACNTGKGKLIRGEGVMSLARSFLQAGARSTVVSMWSVDDCATSEIGNYFYARLQEGQQINEALGLAKLDYLDAASKTKMHPYYWASMVGFGKTNVVLFESDQNGFIIFLLSGLLIFCFWLFNKKKK